jgi:hypothetical protein
MLIASLKVNHNTAPVTEIIAGNFFGWLLDYFLVHDLDVPLTPRNGLSQAYH